MRKIKFPHGFLWGAATSAYQIEGAERNEGRSESIWDRFSRAPAATKDGQTGAVACDHYNRYRQDVELMRDMGLQAYRFSVAWPRVVPDGRGAVNPNGLDFYSRLVDTLLEHGIEPFVTVYHWDLPQVLEDAGGWTNRDTVAAFVEYTHAVSRHLGDRVKQWITHNEPWCQSHLGYRTGLHAPGRRDWPSALSAGHHLLLSHGLAVPVIRENARDAKVGIALNMSPGLPASPSLEDYEAYRHFDGMLNRWFLDPLYRGSYPADIVADYMRMEHVPASGLPFVQPGDLKTITAPIDFLGINYYSRTIVRSEAIPEHRNHPRTVTIAPQSELTDMGWEVYPHGLFEVLARTSLEYGVPNLYVTENGASYGRGPDADGRVRDTARVEYLRDHLVATKKAIDAGAPVRGYFVWSLLDNFEWDRGYTQRFGIVWTDYETQTRIAKDSSHWYGQVIAENGVGLE